MDQNHSPHECQCDLLLKYILETKDHIALLVAQIEHQRFHAESISEKLSEHLDKEEQVWDKVDDIDNMVRGIKNALNIIFRLITFLSVLSGILATIWSTLKNEFKWDL